MPDGIPGLRRTKPRFQCALRRFHEPPYVFRRILSDVNGFRRIADPAFILNADIKAYNVAFVYDSFRRRDAVDNLVVDRDAYTGRIALIPEE